MWSARRCRACSLAHCHCCSAVDDVCAGAVGGAAVWLGAVSAGGGRAPPGGTSHRQPADLSLPHLAVESGETSRQEANVGLQPRALARPSDVAGQLSPCHARSKSAKAIFCLNISRNLAPISVVFFTVSSNRLYPSHVTFSAWSLGACAGFPWSLTCAIGRRSPARDLTSTDNPHGRPR